MWELVLKLVYFIIIIPAGLKINIWRHGSLTFEKFISYDSLSVVEIHYLIK